MSCICIIQLKLITNVVYLGLNELDVEGEWLVLRQVMWKVPQSLVDKSLRLKTDDKGGAVQERKKRSWTLTDTSQQQRGEVREGEGGWVEGEGGKMEGGGGGREGG